MNQIFRHTEANGDRLTITRDELKFALEACIAIQQESKSSNDSTQWLVAAGYSEALRDLLACF